MSQGVFALIGVVLGGLLSTATTVFLAARARRRAERVALRLARTELALSLAAAQTHLKDGDVPNRVTVEAFFPTQAWDAHQPVLADSLSSEDWKAISTAYLSISFLKLHADRMDDDSKTATLRDIACEVAACGPVVWRGDAPRRSVEPRRGG
jgi:hypothetical protein